MKSTDKIYRCTQCGFVKIQNTNHFGNTWSFDKMNTCPKCPPYKKYSEYNGQTIWKCMEVETDSELNKLNK